jgi:hypothetical protein
MIIDLIDNNLSKTSLDLRYQNEGIAAEDNFLILENWIRDVMEAGF